VDQWSLWTWCGPYWWKQVALARTTLDGTVVVELLLRRVIINGSHLTHVCRSLSSAPCLHQWSQKGSRWQRSRALFTV
jgi:hypothetical protein